MRWLTFLALAGGCTPSDADWVVVWEDDFKGAEDAAPDEQIWVHDVGGDGWGNQQLEYNTDRTDNASLDGNGFLRITAKREDYEGNAYTSARLKTLDTFEVQYGRIEARIWLPEGKGLWPAFWMLGADFPDVGWPACGEIDIMEFRGENPSEVLGTLHGPGYSGGSGVGGSVDTGASLADGFHVYAVEWDPDHIAWYVDDTQFFRAHPGDLPEGSPWVYDHEFFLLLNLAVGGTFVEEPDDTTTFPAVMGIDYVRVSQRAEPLYDRRDP